MKRTFSLILALCLILAAAFSCGFALQTSAEPAGNQLAQETVEGGAILHCFDWSYNNIKANIPAIAAAGYTAIQTSPVQQPKDYDPSYTQAYGESGGQWWKLYQPLGLSVADGNTWLGTKEELASMCAEAEKYGLKVIVDIVANHLANSNSSGGGYGNLSPYVEEDLKDPAYYHTDPGGVGDGSRYDMTQKHLGMPDLNTGNAYIQQRVLDLLKECVDLGVDGFRFDAAKHIELPTDPEGVKSDFWPYIINGVSEYRSGLYFYGEILYNAGTDITNYTRYIDITDSVSSAEARSGASEVNAGKLADGRYQMGESPDDAVLWVESHDTFMDGSSSGIPDEKILRAWAIVGSRASSTSLFLARPNEIMGEASADLSWKSPVTAEVNKFKNFFEGTSEYLAFDQEKAITWIERGTNGVVISKLDGGGSVTLSAHRMEDGSYVDRITGNTFTVASGTISGTVGSSGVAVVYNANEAPKDFAPDDGFYLFGYINGADYACEGDAANRGVYRFENGTLTAQFETDSYVAVKKGDNSAWYMTDGWLGTGVTSATLYNTSVTGENSNKLFVPGGVKVTFTLEKGEGDTYTLSYTEAGPDFYLFGSINGGNYGCEEDWETLGDYRFVDGKLTARFAEDSYIAVKTGDNQRWYMTNGWQGFGLTNVTLYNTMALGEDADKLYVPANRTVSFTLTVNGNGTLTLDLTFFDVFGDVNADGILSIADVTALLDLLSGQPLTTAANTDLNADGILSIADVTALLDLLSEAHT